MEDNVITLEFREGKFEGTIFELNTDDFSIEEDENGNILLNYSVNYDKNNELIIKHGVDNFLEEVGKLLMEGIEQEIERLKEYN